MAASGYTPIILFNSTTTGNTPTTSNLAVGELAINVTDGKLFFNQSGTIKVLANATYATSVSTISFGTTGLTPSTATNGVVTVAGTLATTNGGTGLTSFTSGGVVYASSTSALATGSALTFDGTTLTAPQMTLTSSNGLTMNSASGGLIDSSGNTLFIQFPATNSLIFRQSGSPYAEYMRLNSTGLGIGTSSPATKLDVKVANAAGQISLTATTGTNAAYASFVNTAGGFLIGRDNSTGAILSGSAYASCLYSQGAYPMVFFTNSAEAMRIDSAGNLGLGVTPSAWSVFTNVLQNQGGAIASSSVNNIRIFQNSYYNGSNYIYKTTEAASRYDQQQGAHIWFNAPSGTAGNAITFTQAMTLDASGNLGVGTTTPDVFSRGYTKIVGISSSGSTALQINSTGDYPAIELGRGGVRKFVLDAQSTKCEIFSLEAVPMIFATNNTESMRIDSSGNLLIGYTSSNGAYKLQVNSQIFATSAIIATSDARYKTNVTPISNGLALINKLNPVSFDWKEHSVHDFDTKNTNVGFLAQDVQEVLKDEIYLNSVIRKNETELPDGTKEEFLGLSDSSLIPILVKAIQEQQAIIESLKARLDAANL